jgi:hypothetical protein
MSCGLALQQLSSKPAKPDEEQQFQARCGLKINNHAIEAVLPQRHWQMA